MCCQFPDRHTRFIWLPEGKKKLSKPKEGSKYCILCWAVHIRVAWMTVELGLPQLLSDHGFRFFSPSFPQALIPTPVPESIQIKWETIRDRPVGGSLNFFRGGGERCSHWLSSYFGDHCLSCPLRQPPCPRDRVSASAFQALLPSALSPGSKIKPQFGSCSKGSWNHNGVFQLVVKKSQTGNQMCDYSLISKMHVPSHQEVLWCLHVGWKELFSWDVNSSQKIQSQFVYFLCLP